MDKMIIMHIGIHAYRRVEGKELKVVSMKDGDMGLTDEILMESFGKVLGGYAHMPHAHG